MNIIRLTHVARDSSKVLRNNRDCITQCYVTNNRQEFLQRALIGELKLITTVRVARPFPLSYKLQHMEWERGMGLAGQTKYNGLFHFISIPPLLRSTNYVLGGYLVDVLGGY